MNTFILLILVLLFDLILVNLDTNLIRNLYIENIHFTETGIYFLFSSETIFRVISRLKP